MSNWNQSNPRFRRRSGWLNPGGGYFSKLRNKLRSWWRGEKKFQGLLFMVAVLVLVAAVWRFWPHFEAFQSLAPSLAPTSTPVQPQPQLQPQAQLPAPVKPFHGPRLPPLPSLPEGSWSLLADRLSRQVVTETVVVPGGTISQSLETLGLTRQAILSLLTLLENETLSFSLKPGAIFKAYWRDPQKAENDLSRVEFIAEPGQRALVFQTGGEKGFFSYHLASQPLTIHQAAKGRVEETFWEAGEKAGLEPRVIMGVTELLASQIDFVSDIRAGDSFNILFRGQYQDGQLIATPEIEMIQMINDGERFEFYRHEKNQVLAGFYDSSFRSIKKTFFKSPLQFSRISSGFTQKRFHPILKIVRPHLGVDYVAPAGAPVSSVADGVVEFAGRRGGFGLLLVINHSHHYQTMYGHLSRVAKGIQAGAKVKQGDLIGYVGSTGLSTGPHLDFRLRRQNNFVDPIPEMAKQEGAPLPSDERVAFSQEVTRDQARLKELLFWDSSS